jgi:hypothetical protein
VRMWLERNVSGAASRLVPGVSQGDGFSVIHVFKT